MIKVANIVALLIIPLVGQVTPEQPSVRTTVANSPWRLVAVARASLRAMAGRLAVGVKPVERVSRRSRIARRSRG